MTILITRKDYEALPEGTPLVLCDDCRVKQPSPRFGHQRIQGVLLMELQRLLGPARAVAGPVDVLVDELNVFAPDIVALDDVPDDEAQYVGVPAVVFEVLSPSTQECDRTYKSRRLLGLGVREIWLIDRHERTVEVVDLEGARLAHADEPVRSRVIEGFHVVPSALFRSS